MAVSGVALNEDLGISNIFKQIKYNRDFYKNNPTYFRPDGLVIFCGPQGSGKTLSAVNYVYNLLKFYPKCIVVSNIELTDYPFDGVRCFEFTEARDLTRYKNGKEGVIFLVDEIQLYFNSLGSKNIDMDVMTQIAQQRKQRIHIVATSQVFGRMAKPLREQFDVVIYCQKKFFGYLQKNSLIDRTSIDGESSTGTNLKGKVVKNYFYFKNPESFVRYDTYKVIQNKNLKIEKESNDIYNDNTTSIYFPVKKGRR